MNKQLNIDLRKRHPLGVELSTSTDACKEAYQTVKRLGPGLATLPGYREHRQLYNQTLNEAHRLHDLLIAIANMVGDEVASKLPELRWAMTTNFDGDCRPEPYLGFLMCYAIRKGGVRLATTINRISKDHRVQHVYDTGNGWRVELKPGFVFNDNGLSTVTAPAKCLMNSFKTIGVGGVL